MIDSSDEEEEIKDLLQLIDELNSNADLTVKLNNQSKICKILQQSPDIHLQSISETEPYEPMETTSQARLRIKSMLESCKKELEALQAEKDQAVEDFLESLAEEKFMA